MGIRVWGVGQLNWEVGQLTHSSDWYGLYQGLWSRTEFWGRQDAHFLICHLCFNVGFSSFTLTLLGPKVPVLFL